MGCSRSHIVIDLSAEVAEQRMQERTKDRMESNNENFTNGFEPVTLSVLRNKHVFASLTQNKA